MIHAGSTRLSTPIQKRPISPPLVIEELVAPRRTRKLHKRREKKVANEKKRIHGDSSMIFHLPSSIYTGMSPPSSSGMMRSNSARSLSPLWQGNNSSVLFGSAGTSTLGGNMSVNIDRSKKLLKGSSKHRARILTVGPKDVVYAGQSFNETAVTDIGNFTLSDVIGRNYTPSSSALTMRVVSSLMNGAPSSKDAQEVRYQAPPPPLSINTIQKNSNDTEIVMTDSQRKQSEKSLTYELNPRTGEKMIYAMSNNKNKRNKKFNPNTWNPRGLAPEIVITTENRLKTEVSKYSVAVLSNKNSMNDPNFDLRSEDSTMYANGGTDGSTNGSINSSGINTITPSKNMPSRNGKWSLTDDPSYFQPVSSYSDSVLESVNQYDAGSKLVPMWMIETGNDIERKTPKIIQETLAMNSYNETNKQKESDYGLRKNLIDKAVGKMCVLPTNKREQLVILSSLKELAFDHRVASAKASIIYNGMDAGEQDNESITETSQSLKEMNINEINRIKQNKLYLSKVRVKIQNKLCICEPLLLDLRNIWLIESSKLNLNLINDKEFISNMPMPLNDFSNAFTTSVIETRKILIDEWLPETLKLCLAHLVAFIRMVKIANQKEEERIELERSKQITQNANKWMPSSMENSLKLKATASNTTAKTTEKNMEPLIIEKSRVAQEFVHLRDPNVLFKARAPTTINDLENVLRDSLLALCVEDDDNDKNVRRCENLINNAMSKRSKKENLILNFTTMKQKCENLLLCAGALLSKQVRSVADDAINSVCQFFKQSITKDNDKTRTSHPCRGGPSLPRQITDAQLIAACMYHMKSHDSNCTSGSRFSKSRFSRGLELLNAKPVFSIIQLEVTMSKKIINKKIRRKGSVVEESKSIIPSTPSTVPIVPTITPSKDILLQTSYHCIDSIVDAVTNFPRFDINAFITHHMTNWDNNFKRSQRSQHSRSPRSTTQPIPPTTLTLSSASIQKDHPTVVEARQVIKHCIDTTYDDASGILPTIQSFCHIFQKDQDVLAQDMITKQKNITLNAMTVLSPNYKEKKMVEKQNNDEENEGRGEEEEVRDVTDVLALFHDIDFDYSIHLNLIRIEYNRLINTLRSLLITFSNDSIYLPFFSLSIKLCINTITDRINELCNYYRTSILLQLEDTIRVVSDEFETMARGLISVPNDANELRLLSDYYIYCNDRRMVLHSRIRYEIKGLVNVLMVLDHVFHVKHQIQISNAWSWPKKSSYFFRKNQKIIKDKRNEMSSELNRLIKMHERDMKALESDVKGMRRSGTLRDEHRLAMKNKLIKCRSLHSTLNISSHEINKLELILNPKQKVTDYHKRLKNINRLLEPYENIWTNIEKYYKMIDLWRHSNLHDMDSKVIFIELNDIKKNLIKGRIFLRKQNGTSPLQATDQLLDELNEFELKEVPLISLFATKALEQRHWDQIAGKTKIEDIKQTRRRNSIACLVDVGLLRHLPDVEDIVIAAKKEMSATIMLNDMKQVWSDKCFEITSINTDENNPGYDDLILVDTNNNMRCILDEHLTTTDNMRGTCRFEHLIPSIVEWYDILMNISNTIVSIHECQKIWKYLYPLFTSPDIRLQMVVSAANFDVSDDELQKILKKMMKSTCTNLCQNKENTTNIIKTIKECKERLELIKAKLYFWLNEKRVVFPRFYFLSNDEMLRILCASGNTTTTRNRKKKSNKKNSSISSNPNDQVSTIIPRIFNGIDTLLMKRVENTSSSGNNNSTAHSSSSYSKWVVIGMKSKTGEHLFFNKHVVPEGNVEHWLEEIEWRMKISVGQEITKCLTTKDTYKNHVKWITHTNLPGQIINLCELITLTRILENCYQSSVTSQRKLREMDTMIEFKLKSLIVYIRNSSSIYKDRKKKKRKTKTKKDLNSTTSTTTTNTNTNRHHGKKMIENVIIINMHTRDTINKMIENKINTKSSFEMESSMRFYWRPRTGKAKQFKSKKELKEVEGRNLFEMLQVVKEEKEAEKKQKEKEEALKKDTTKKKSLKDIEMEKQDAIDEKLNDYDPVYVSMMSCELNYDNEYVGTNQRLIITPLVLKCQRTLINAFHRNYGYYCRGNGSAAVSSQGKSETCKDIASSLGLQTIVSTCTSRETPVTLGQLFKGIATTGAWCVLKNFNKIIPSVMSIVATQITTILHAKQSSKSLMEFEGQWVNINLNCYLCFTGNPINAMSSSGMPDNLLKMIRCLSIYKPDLFMICSMKLYLLGFSDSTMLASKIIASMKLSKTQLNKNIHYIFDIRYLLRVLSLCSLLIEKYKLTHSTKNSKKDDDDGTKKLNTTRDETVMCMEALWEVTKNYLMYNDIVDFKYILKDIFIGEHLNIANSQKNSIFYDLEGFSTTITQTCTDHGINTNTTIVSKLNDIHTTSIRNGGILLLGKSYTGKSTLIKMIIKINKIKTTSTPIIPTSMTTDELYGTYHTTTREWIDGVLPIIFRKQNEINSKKRTGKLEEEEVMNKEEEKDNEENSTEEEENKQFWIIMDGDMSSHWIDSMYTVLDDNNKLCLMNGETIHRRPNM